MKHYLLFLILLSAIVLNGCISGEIADSKDVAQSEIFTKYYVSMEGGERNALVEAVFRFGGSKGTSLILTEPSSVSVNGNGMKGKEGLFTGYYYSILLKQPDNYQYTFIFTDLDGKKYQNTFYLYPVEISDKPDFNKNKKTELSITGLPIQKHETFKLTIIDTAGTEKTIKYTKEGLSTLIVEPEELSELKEGPCKFYLTREVSLRPAQCPEIGGLYEGTYKSKVKKSSIISQ